jgi:predicted metalloprotease with PDZ domain
VKLARWVIGLLSSAPAAMALAQPPAAEHFVSFPHRHNQYVEVRLQLPVDGGDVELAMPSWTPGSYLIRDYAAQVERLRARGGEGRPLEVEKIAKNRWRVAAGDEQAIVVDYAVWAGELAVHTNWVEADHALLNGAGMFLYSAASRDWPQYLDIDLPPEWKRVHTALPQASAEHRFLARDYDELIDSPVLAGNAPEYRFSAEGHEYVLVNQGETGLWDGARAAQDAGRIVSAVQAFWGVNPFDRPYLFLNVIAEGSGGLEHDHSTVLLATPWQMRYREDYIRWLSLLTHEFFHAWNVRRLRPRALLDYDYDREVYTRELWLAEGLTSYYDNLLLFRSGVISVEEYLALLASEIHTYETAPGRQVRSAELASFDAWIKHYKPDANSINSVVSYYRKGALIGFVTDTMLRRVSRHRVSLDTVMRDLYRLYGPAGSRGEGYPARSFEALVEAAAGAEARSRVETLLTTVEDPDIDQALGWYGLQLDRSPLRTAAEAAGRPVPVDFGLVWRQNVPNLVAEVVVQGGTGAAAGILPADELLAINDTRVTRDNLADRMQRLAPGETVNLLLARHGRVFTLPVRVQHAIPEKYLVSIRPDVGRREKERLETWLGVALKFVKN